MAREQKAPSDYVDQDATELQERFVEYLLSEEVGADPASCKSKGDAFALGVKLGTSLRIVFQRSDFNQEARKAAAAERAAAAKATAKKASPKKAAEAAEDTDEDEEEEEPAKPTKAAKAAAAKKAAGAKKATKSARGRAAAAEEEPF